MATQSGQQNPKLDRYIVIHVATTCDEHGVYVTKDSAEVIEIGWILLDSANCEEIARDSVLVKPVNTPITPLCTSLTTLTWEHVRGAGTFREAVDRISNFFQTHVASNQECAFVTLDSWDLRVQLPREARDKSVVLPPYLQHSRTFDLRTEYQRWQSYHPEVLNYGASSLANICAALEVEPVQASAPIKHNLPFHLQALAPASPRRAMEEAVTYARVLQGLIRKAQPQGDHPDVLTRPMDARADVRAFLAERSKVLHMSGLPYDTTQSELESWFTQFGGRPIAFWTLRTPDQHKPTGTGFAVFSSHEEAAESLCMNGRALNEKAVEVSPSSSRVLDRAAEILTPFPPSKNRPRPGDWTCPSCGFSNFQRRTACFRCSYPAVGGPGGGGGGNDMGYQNFGGGGGGYGGPHMMGGPHHHMGHHGGHGMGHGRGMGGGGMVPFRAGDWKCGNEGCGYHNFAKNINCLRCNASRAGAAVVADSSFTTHIDPPPQPGYGMGPPGPMGGNPGPGPFGPPGGYGSNAFGGGSGFGGPNAYPPPGAGGWPQMGGSGYPQHSGGSGGGSHHTPFDSRATEAAFSSAGNTSTAQSTGGSYNSHIATSSAANDPFDFLSGGMNNLSVGGDESRRNGANSTRSPTT